MTKLPAAKFTGDGKRILKQLLLEMLERRVGRFANNRSDGAWEYNFLTGSHYDERNGQQRRWQKWTDNGNDDNEDDTPQLTTVTMKKRRDLL